MGFRDLEDEVYNALQRQILPQFMGLDPLRTKVMQRQRYYSEARKSWIETDIAVELCLSGAPSPFLRWIWECKDYNRPVPVDDIEEFDSKLRQIGEHNTKGTVVTRHAFQRSAIEFARSKGIGLARLDRHGELIIIGHGNFGDENVAVEHEAIRRLATPEEREYLLFGGLTVDGVFGNCKTFDEFIAGQVFSLLPEQEGTCRACGNTETPFRLLGRYRLTHVDDDPGELSTTETQARIWLEHPLCRPCASLVRASMFPVVMLPITCLFYIFSLMSLIIPRFLNMSRASRVALMIGVPTAYAASRWIISGLIRLRMRKLVLQSKHIVLVGELCMALLGRVLAPGRTVRGWNDEAILSPRIARSRVLRRLVWENPESFTGRV